MFFKILFYLSLCIVLCTGCTSAPEETVTERITAMPVVIKDGDNWSLADKAGKIYYRNMFENQPSAVVENLFSVKDSSHYVLYKFGAQVPEIVKGCEILTGVGVMNGGLIPVTKPNSRIEVINAAGETRFVLSPYNNEEIIACDVMFHDSLLVVQVNSGNLGFVNTKGQMVIPPVYSQVSKAANGLIVATKGEDDTSLLNTKGETILKFEEGWTQVGEQLDYGYFVVRNAEEQLLIVDKEGKTLKLPHEVKAISRINDKYAVFFDENKYGVITLPEMRIIVKPQYKSISLLPDGKFLCVGDKYKSTIINPDGKIVHSIDKYRYGVEYEDFFGLIGVNDSNIVVLNPEGKPLKGMTFSRIGTANITSMVESDFFNYKPIEDAVRKLVASGGVGKYQFGERAQDILEGSPGDFFNVLYPVVEEISGTGIRYEYRTLAGFTEILTRINTYGAIDPTASTWNSNSRLAELTLEIRFEREISDTLYNAIRKIILEAGYKEGAAYSDNDVTSRVYRNNETGEVVLMNAGRYEGQTNITIVAMGNCDERSYQGYVEAIESNSYPDEG